MTHYKIRVEGALDARWTEWFGGLVIRPEGSNVTLISGDLADQPAVHRLLTRLRDLGLVLISVERCACADPPKDKPRA